MRPALHSHNIENEVPVYGPLQTGITTSTSPYHTFSTPVQHVDPAIEHDLSSFGHGHNEDAHAANQHGHMQNNGLHLDAGLPPETALIGRQHLHKPSPTSHPDDFAPQPPRTHSHAPVPPPPPQIPNSAPPGQFDMLPPPASTHSTWQALHDYAQSHASAHGYALSINTTAKNRSRIKLACVCYGAPKNTHKLTPETRVRKNRVSYKTGCKMWVEGKKQEDGLWILRVGEPMHNHPGRAVEGWALQRKRTWGVQGGRIGVGGVTAKEEKQRSGEDGGIDAAKEDEQDIESPSESRKTSHSLESGGLVWKIVEQEMLRKGGPGQGRDRGVGRTVKVLQERLPGIHIFKRDVYNIRAQIKRARKAAGQQIGEGLDDNEQEDNARTQDQDEQPDDEPPQDEENSHESTGRNFPEIDPMLVAQCNDALRSVTEQEESEVDRLRREVEQLRQALAQRTRELEERNSENESLRVQVELAHMAVYNSERGAHSH